MSPEEKKHQIDLWQKRIQDSPYKHTIPYPYCCRCFERLTPENICEEIDRYGKEWLIDVCLECKDNEVPRKIQDQKPFKRET